MKEAIRELRMYFAELLLNLAFTVAPSTHTDGRKLKVKIIEYLDEIINNK